MADFQGEFYRRKRSNDFRNRRTGSVVKKVTIEKRRGMRNKAIVFDGTNFKSVESTGKNFYGFDIPPKRDITAKRRFENRVRSDKERRAMFKKIRGRR